MEQKSDDRAGERETKPLHVSPATHTRVKVIAAREGRRLVELVDAVLREWADREYPEPAVRKTAKAGK